MAHALTRRSFLHAPVALAAGTSMIGESAEPERPLVAYVGTFSSPLRNVLPTQVDRPPGNGRGIHLFHANRDTGVLAPRDI